MFGAPSPFSHLAKAAARLRPGQHWALALSVLVLVLVGAGAAIHLFGNADALGPRRVVAVAAPPADYAPRVALADAAVDAPSALLGAQGMTVDASDAAGPAIIVDPTIDAGALPAGRAANTGAAGLKAGLGPLPPTLDPIPDAAIARPSPLPKAPLAGLHERGPRGLLPIIAPDGRTAARAYARPLSEAGGARAPRVALIVGGLGFNARATAAAIDELPPEVTLSFMPYSAGLQGLIDRARAQGHEVLIELPMESWDPRGDNTGPQTLTVAGPAVENIARLESILGRGVGYFGVMNYMGQRFATAPEAVGPVVAALRARGLLLVGNGVGGRSALALEAQRAGLPFLPADRIIDARRDGEAIAEQLLSLETLAQRQGAALGVGFAFPVTIDQIKVWARDLKLRGLTLAPASAVIAARMAR
jgi:uncharacterized protein